MKKSLFIFRVAFLILLMIPSSASAEVGVGIDWKIKEDLTLVAARLDWRWAGSWGLGGRYEWNESDLSMALLHHKRLGSTFNQYTGLGVRDLLGTRGNLSIAERLEMTIGFGMDLGRLIPGWSTALEIRVNPNDLFDSSKVKRFSPSLGLALQYRFLAYSGDEDLLARLITAEAAGEPYEGQLGVGAVVMNRVKSPDFPNTIREVIYQKNQFSSLPKIAKIKPTPEALRAAGEALRGKDPVGGALFFYNPALSSLEGLRFFASADLTVIKRIGRHVFLR